MKWLTDAPDVAVTLCPAALGGFVGSDYRYGGQIVFSYMFSIGAFVIEHPAEAANLTSQNIAGVDGALKAYRAIINESPDAKSSELEMLIDLQKHGLLSDFVGKAVVDCSKSRGQVG